MSPIKKPSIGPGTKFHSIIADANPEWEVTRARGRGVWEAKCLGEDYRGEIRIFTRAQVQQSLGMAQFFAKNASDHDKFYSGLTLGAIVHYSHSFGEFVRCEVVMGTTAYDKKPHKCLKAIALVGTWKEWDLPRRRPDGRIDSGYSAKSVMTGECLEPNFTNIYESGLPSARMAGVDPRCLPPIDLSVPDMTADQLATQKLWQAVQAAKDVLEGGPNGDRDPKQLLTKALEVIQGALPSP